MRRRWFFALTLLAAALTVFIGATLLSSAADHGLDRLQGDIQSAAPLLSIMRFLVIGGLYLAWPSLLHFCSQRDWISKEARQQLLSRRARLATWLIALELILGFEVLNHLHALIDKVTP